MALAGHVGHAEFFFSFISHKAMYIRTRLRDRIGQSRTRRFSQRLVRGVKTLERRSTIRPIGSVIPMQVHEGMHASGWNILVFMYAVCAAFYVLKLPAANYPDAWINRMMMN